MQVPDPKRPDDPRAMTISGCRTPLDYFFFARPVLLPPVWTIALLGATHRQPALASIPAWRWVIFFVQLASLFGAVYTLNQIFDIESDRANRKLFFLPEGLISVSNAWRFTVLLNVVAIGAATVFGPVYSGLTMVIVLLGIVYSVGSKPWKNHPLGGFFANVVAHGVIVHAMGVAFTGTDPRVSGMTSLAYGSAVGAVYLATTVADIPGDHAANKRTLGVILRPRMTMLLALAMVICACGLSAWHDEWRLLIAAGLALPVYTWCALQTNPARAPLAARTSVALLTVAAATAYPAYLAPLIAGYFGTRAFFLWRFRMTYPTFF